ncbi:MAG: ATP synthase F0 subunit B [Desulfobacterales bacterium]|nr:MAG: ATP synthase F0 subunit B [Desulfobacterales bacterium]
MNVVKKIFALIGCPLGGLVIFHLLGSEALATETEVGWRSNYDLIMMWVNFAILVIVLIKFGKNPIKGFFRDQKEKISRTIGDIEAQKEENAAQIWQTQQLMQESNARFEEIKEKIVAEGERKKQAIIESARRESKLMIDNANFWIERQVLQAKKRLKSELIDEAVEQALQRLPQALTPEDNQKLINRYLTEIDAFTK